MSNTFQNSFKKSYSTSNKGVTFLDALALLFIGLKLTGNIAWSWWWVLAPLWIPVVVVLAVALIALVFLWATKRL